jgi:hypothetical protein
MVFDPRQVDPEQVKRLTQFPPDLMAWNALFWSAWMSWLAMMGLDLEAWERSWASTFESQPGGHPRPPTPAVMPVAANDEAEDEPLPEGEPVPPSFA